MTQRKKGDIPNLRRMSSSFFSSNIEQIKPRYDAVPSSSSIQSPSLGEMKNTIKHRENSSRYNGLYQLWHFLFKIDTLMVLSMIVYASYSNDTFLSDMVVGGESCGNKKDSFNSIRLICKLLPPLLQSRAFVELANLVIQGVVERALILPLVTYMDETNVTSTIRFTPLPDTQAERNEQFQEASKMPAPFLHNKNAILMNLIILLPLEIGTNLLRNYGTGEVAMTNAISTLTLKQICKSLLLGLLIIDLMLGTAHKISHR